MHFEHPQKFKIDVFKILGLAASGAVSPILLELDLLRSGQYDFWQWCKAVCLALVSIGGLWLVNFSYNMNKEEFEYDD